MDFMLLGGVFFFKKRKNIKLVREIGKDLKKIGGETMIKIYSIILSEYTQKPFFLSIC